MLADFYIPRLSNDMKIALQKNHLGRQILYKSLDPPKKTASSLFSNLLSLHPVGDLANKWTEFHLKIVFLCRF